MWQWVSWKIDLHLLSKMDCVGLYRCRNEVGCLQLHDRGQKACLDRGLEPCCDKSSVSQKRCRVTRDNTARRVKFFQFNSVINTVDGVLMIILVLFCV